MIPGLADYVARYQLLLPPKTVEERVLEPFEVQEAFQKFLLYKFSKHADPIPLKIEAEFPLKHLPRLSHLAHEGELPDERHKIQQDPDWKKIPASSPFKQYLMDAGALDLAPKQNIRYALQVLCRILKIDLEESEAYDLKTWNEVASQRLYARFLEVLATAQYDPRIERINRPGKNDEQKIQETLALLNALTGRPGIQKLKDALSLKITEEDLGDFPGMGLAWNPQLPLLKQRDEKFNSLCLSTLLEISKTRRIEIDLLAFYLAKAGHDFSGLQSVIDQMPKLGEKIKDKITALCKELGMQVDPDLSAYDLHRSFKEAFKERCAAVKERMAGQEEALEEMQLAQNIPMLLKIESEIPSVIEVKMPQAPSPTNSNTTIEERSVDSNDVPLEEKPKVHLIENLETFWAWIRSAETSVFKRFVLQKRLVACVGAESQLLEMGRFTVELYIDLLRQEAEMMKEPLPDEIHSLDELETLSGELSYKKFLRGLNAAKKKYEKSSVFDELEKISKRDDIPIKEKRDLSIKELGTVRPEEHLEKLFQYLIALFTLAPIQKASAIDLEAFSSPKTKCAALNWLVSSSFVQSLEVDVKTDLKGALRAFEEKIKNEINRLDMPPIYSDILDDHLKKGNVEGLKRLSYEVGYQRYVNAIMILKFEEGAEVLRHLSDFDATLVGISPSECVKKSKEQVRKIATDKELFLKNYLLFQLQQLPFDSRELSDASKELISGYLQNTDSSSRPFDLYLQKNHYSWIGYSEEPCDWFCYLQEQFIKQLTQEAEKSKFSTTQMLCLELKNLDPFDLAKLDRLARFIQDPKRGITVQELYTFGFKWSVAKVLNTPGSEGNHQSYFEAIKDVSIQIDLLDHLSKSLGLSHLVYPTISLGDPRSADVGYEFLKFLMLQPGIEANKGALSSFFCLHFLGYPEELMQRIAKEDEEEAQKFKQLEELMLGELSNSPLRDLFKQDGVIDESGRCRGLFALMPEHKIEPYVRRIKAFAEVNTAIENPSPYLGRDSWVATLRSIHNRLEGVESTKHFTSCRTEDVDNLIRGVLEHSSDSFSSCLQKIGIRPLARMQADAYYEQYLLWEKRAVSCFEEKVIKLRLKLDGSLGASKVKNVKKVKRLPEFAKSFEDVKDSSIFTKVIQTLKTGIEHRDWKTVNNSADHIIHAEYQHELIGFTAGQFKGREEEAIKIVLPNEGKGSSRDKIRSALNNLPECLSANDQARLLSILMNREWMDKLEDRVQSKWEWALSKVYLRNFSDMKVDPATLSLFEKEAVLDNIFCALAESLLREVKDLAMNEGYLELIKTAFYEDCLFLWDWLVEEVVYQKGLSYIQEAKAKGEDMSMFDDLNEITQNCTIYEKIQSINTILDENKLSSPVCQRMLTKFTTEDFIKAIPLPLLSQSEDITRSIG